MLKAAARGLGLLGSGDQLGGTNVAAKGLGSS